MSTEFETVHNFFERVIFHEVAQRASGHPDMNGELLADVACVALNRIAPRYIRHDVDLMFYLTESERHQMEQNIESALQFAFDFVRERRQRYS